MVWDTEQIKVESYAYSPWARVRVIVRTQEYWEFQSRSGIERLWVEALLKSDGMDRAAASGVGLNDPDTSVPLACAGRSPGCFPKISSSCATRSSLRLSRSWSAGRGIASELQPSGGPGR